MKIVIAVRALKSRDLAVAADGDKLLLGVDPALPRLMGRSGSSVVGDLEVIGAELSGVVLGYPSDNLLKPVIYIYTHFIFPYERFKNPFNPA